jgi:hypothetical protein
MKRSLLICCLLAACAALSGCATLSSSSQGRPYEITPQKTILLKGEFEFMMPPEGWKLVWGEEDNDFEFGFMRMEAGLFPSQSMMVYDEDPFGVSRDLDLREKQFFKRFLWNAHLKFETLERKKETVLGGEGSALVVEGKDPVRGEKVRAKLVFGKRGERVVGFYLTQWRPIAGAYDLAAFDTFDQFWKSLKFAKKSFYESF